MSDEETNEKVTVSGYVPKETQAVIEAHAKVLRRSVSSLVSEILEGWVEERVATTPSSEEVKNGH